MCIRDSSDLTTNQYNAMLVGIVNGVLQQEGLTEIETCIGDGEAEAKDAYTAFEDLVHKQWVAGFEELGVIAKALPNLLSDCTHFSDDIAKLKSWAVVFEDPADLQSVITTNIKHNLLKLTRDLNRAKGDWKNEEYFAFGTELGTMLVIATQPLTMQF